jgi:hypothetical protein
VRDAGKIEGAAEGCRGGLSAKRGETRKAGPRCVAADGRSMSEKQLEDFAKGSRKGKPEHVKSD